MFILKSLNEIDAPYMNGILLEESDDKGSKGGNDTTKTGGASFQQVQESFNNLLNRYSDAEKAAWQLFNENKDYRDRINNLQSKLPGDNQKVISKEDADLLEKVKSNEELSKRINDDGVESVSKALKEGAEARAKVEKMERDQARTDIAKAYGYNEKPFIKLAEDVELETEYETVDGEKRVKAFVQTGENERVELSEFVDKNWAEFKPSLQADDEAGGKPGDGGNSNTRNWINQSPANKNGKKAKGSDLLQERLKRNRERAGAGNPLAPNRNNVETENK